MEAAKLGIDYRRRVDIRAPRDRIFDAVGTVEGLRGWWTPLVVGAAETGGQLCFAFEGLDEQVVMRVGEATRPSTVRWTCTMHTGHPEWVGTTIAFDIGERDLWFRHVGLVPELQCYGVCELGWDRFLASLAAYAETGRGAPFRATYDDREDAPWQR